MRSIGLSLGSLLCLVACNDTGKVPFTDNTLFEQGVAGRGGTSSGGTGGGVSSGGTSGGTSSCVGYCGNGTRRTGGCFCDDACNSKGDCCEDWYDVCQSSACSAYEYEECNSNGDCCGYPSSAICVNFSQYGTICAPRCDFGSCDVGCCVSTRQGNNVCDPSCSG